MTTAALFLLTLTALSALFDLRTGKVPNRLCAAGLTAGVALHLCTVILSQPPSSPASIQLLIKALLLSLAGAALPFALGFPLFRFRMIGAGDIKLLMAAGAIVGDPRKILIFMILSIIIAAVISLLIMIFVTGIRPRIRHLLTYIMLTEATGEILPYRDSPDAEFHFTVPVFLAAVIYTIKPF